MLFTSYWRRYVFVFQYKEKLDAITTKYTVKKSDIMKQSLTRKDDLDKESEELATQFIQGEKEYNAFISEYLAKRQEYHCLNAKLISVQSN